jgi:hypothetical protein
VSKKLVFQGKLDGFCGIYSAAHIIAMKSDNDYEDAVELAFFGMLKSLEKLGHLTAKRIAGPEAGFSDLMIAKAVNNMPSRNRGSLGAVAFRKSVFHNSNLAKRAKELISEGAGFVIQENGGAHWIAVTGLTKNGNYRCFDPWHSDPKKKRERIPWDEGVLIAPDKFIRTLV